MESYVKWLQFLQYHDAPLYELGRICPYLHVAERKVIMVQCRCQIIPTRKSRLYRRIPERSWKTRFSLPKDIQEITGSRTLLELSHTLTPYMTPFYAGFISMLLRNAPYDDYDSVEAELQDGITKEIKASQEIYHPTTLDYSAFLSLDNSDLYTRMEQNLPLSWDTNLEIRRCFILGKKAIGAYPTILFPDTSDKTIGQEARENSRNTRQLEEIIEKKEVESTEDLERYYHRTGMILAGRTEMRSAWKYNDLKPRVYYARGPDVYYASRYIQTIFNIILDTFHNVNRYTRYRTSDVPLDKEDIAFIYDYSSFTSTLHEIRNFTEKLGMFYKGTQIRILDTHHGILSVDVGDLILDYNQKCNIEGEFDASNLLGVPDLVLQHNCGMLGVPGNISSCTLLHGIHLSVIVEGIKANKCVGDDAFGALKRKDQNDHMTRKETLRQLRNIGVINEQKVEWWIPEESDFDDWDEETWNYLKRPIVRIEPTKIDTGELIDWPGLANVLGLDDGYHTIHGNDLGFRQKTYGAQLIRFLTVVEKSITTTEVVCAFLSRFMRMCHTVLKIPRGGMCPEPGLLAIWVPPQAYSGSYVDHMKEANSAKVVRLPKIYQRGVEEETIDLTPRASFTVRSNRVLSLLVKLGYMTRDLELEEVICDEAQERIEMLIQRGQDRNHFLYLYHFVVLSRVPDWAYDLLDEAHVPHERSQQALDVINDTEIWEYLSP